MKSRAGMEFSAFLSAYEFPAQRGLRVNSLKISKEDFLKISPFPLEQVSWEENGFYLNAEKAGADVYHFAGLYYLQEPSAMCAAPRLEVKPGERVLDLCAAPGGKTAQLASDMQGKGILVANEIEMARAQILSQNVERMGIKNCIVTSSSPEQLALQFSNYFDKILVDAPCSGEGMFKKEPNAIAEWSEKNVERCARRQREILESAAKMLCGGGRMVYSTCTFAEEEDEWQMENFLSRHAEFELLEMKKLLPHRVRGEGHFCAVLLKREGIRSRGRAYPIRHSEGANGAVHAFGENFFELPENRDSQSLTTLPDGRIYLVPAGAPDFGNIRLLRFGVELGEWDGKLFKPSHALAMAFGAEAARKIALSRQEAIRYLHGETLSAELENGWCVVCVEEYPIGLGKVVNGVVKNHLPKGLRMIQ